MIKLLLPASAFTLASFMPAQACSPSDFQIKQFTIKDTATGDFKQFVGEIVNNCDEPAGPHLNIVVRHADGTVADVTPIWPNLTNNMPAHSSRAFTGVMFSPPKGAKIETIVVEVAHFRH
jgi:hypothetical protein